jgi:hypothetical protein
VSAPFSWNVDTVFARLPPLVDTITTLLSIGVPVDEIADKAAELLAYSDPDAVGALAQVLAGAARHTRSKA